MFDDELRQTSAWHGERDGGDVARFAPTYLTYLPREPHATVLYRLVKEHGAEFLRHARESAIGANGLDKKDT